MGGFLLFASHLANALAGQQPAWFDWRVIGIDLVVGFNEEVAFRGLFQRALSEWKGLGWGEWLGALMFTAMHLGYEPLSEMVYIFLWGLGAAKLRSRGAAIGFLIGVHWLSDSAYVVCWRTSALPHHWLVWARVACLVGVFGAVWLDKRKNGALSAARA